MAIRVYGWKRWVVAAAVLGGGYYALQTWGIPYYEDHIAYEVESLKRPTQDGGCIQVTFRVTGAQQREYPTAEDRWYLATEVKGLKPRTALCETPSRQIAPGELPGIVVYGEER